MENFVGVLGKNSLEGLFDKGFLSSNGGPYEIGPDTVDYGVQSSEAWISREPYASVGRFTPDLWGERVQLNGLVLKPGQTLVAPAAVNLNLLEGYAFMSPRSRMARVGVEPTTYVEGFTERDWAHSSTPLSRKLWMSVSSRIPVTGLDKVALAQMRLFTGDTRLGRKEMLNILRSGHRFLVDPVNGSELPMDRQERAIAQNGTLVTTLHLREGQLVGFRLKKKTPVLDLSATGQNWKEFFEPVYAKKDGNGDIYVDLLAGEYYLLITAEAINLPKGYVASLEQLDSRLIAAAVHFAEYFGHGFKGAATLEVVPIAARSIRVYKGSPVGAFRLECVEANAPLYTGFSKGQNLVPQLPPMLTMYKPSR